MRQQCSICTNTQAAAIDAALHAGTALRHIAAQWEVSTSSLVRHNKHRPQAEALPATAALLSAAASERPQDPPAPRTPLNPHDTAWLTTYRKVQLVSDALKTLTVEDWERGARVGLSAVQHQYAVCFPFQVWRKTLEYALRARGIDPEHFNR